VGEGGDEVSVARFIADQRTFYRVPHTMTCALLGVSLSWFYKWISRTPTPTQRRRAEVDAAVAKAFSAARGLHGSPRLHADLRAAGWMVSEKTVADSMRRQGLVARKIRRRNGLTRQDKTAPKFADLLRRDPRRTVTVTCSLTSGALVAALALPGLPLPVLVGVLFLAVLLEPPFLSARSALLAEVLPDDRYLLASTVFNVTQQTAQVAGFAAGGILVGLIGARPALLLDAATFALGALLILLVSPGRPPAVDAATNSTGSKVGWWSQITGGARLIATNPRLRVLVGLAWLATCWVVPEGIAAPYARILGGGSATIGLLLAAQPAGTRDRWTNPQPVRSRAAPPRPHAAAGRARRRGHAHLRRRPTPFPAS
jgi:hypothetical protein